MAGKPLKASVFKFVNGLIFRKLTLNSQLWNSAQWVDYSQLTSMDGLCYYYLCFFICLCWSHQNLVSVSLLFQEETLPKPELYVAVLVAKLVKQTYPREPGA